MDALNGLVILVLIILGIGAVILIIGLVIARIGMLFEAKPKTQWEKERDEHQRKINKKRDEARYNAELIAKAMKNENGEVTPSDEFSAYSRNSHPFDD